ETREEEDENFDPIPRTPEESEEESNDKEDQDLRLSEEARIQEEEDTDEFDVGVKSIFTTTSSPIVSLETPTPIMTPSTIATITTSGEAPIPPPTIPSIILENLPMFNSAFRFEERLRSLETSFFEYRQTNQFADAVSAIPADLSEMELKKILIEKLEGNKSIQRSDEQRNLYKAREDDDQEGPSAGSDRGSKRQKEGEEPVQTTCQMEEILHLVFETDFSNFIMHRFNVNTLTPDLLAGPTYELIRGSCTSLTELEYHLEQVYKATTDQLDWVNPEGQQRIIAVTELQIMEWHDYKHLDWISVRRDDDEIYKFKEGDFKRLRLQDIEDMLLLLVQGKISNLTIEEHLAFNVSLRMFTRSIVIKRRVEDLQLGVESYQKKLNLTKPDTLMRIDKLHKFSDGTLNDVRNALDDCLKGIQMQYLPSTIWRKDDKGGS
nr:hypothetical protein [Tanacetum cinerariifolium]